MTTGPAASPHKSRPGLGRLVSAGRFSMQGLRAAWRHEAAFRQEVVVGLVLIPVGLVMARSAAEALLLIGAIVLVWIVELLNSALEAVADAVTIEQHPLIGRAKDLGSAAVLLALLLAAVVWVVVLWPRPIVGS